jgi:hypothetical protein
VHRLGKTLFFFFFSFFEELFSSFVSSFLAGAQDSHL